MSQALRVLATEFPDKADRIGRLGRENPRFVKLVNAYHALSREIRRGDPDRGSNTDEQHLRKMRQIVRGKIEQYLS